MIDRPVRPQRSEAPDGHEQLAVPGQILAPMGVDERWQEVRKLARALMPANES